MAIDPRRSGAALWALWVAAGALGGALATLFVLSPLGAMVSGYGNPAPLPYNLQFFAYTGALSAIATSFQSLLLAYVLSMKRAAVLWLLATLIGASLVADLFREQFLNFTLSSAFTSLPADTKQSLMSAGLDAFFPVGLGLVQGLLLMFLTGRKVALPIWLAGTLLVMPLLGLVRPVWTSPNLFASNASAEAFGAAVTGLALVLILRLPRRARPTAPVLAARSPLAPTP